MHRDLRTAKYYSIKVKTGGAASGLARLGFEMGGLGRDGLGDHLFQEDFKGFGVTAPTVHEMVFAIAFPGAIVVTDGVVVITAVKLN